MAYEDVLGCPGKIEEEYKHNPLLLYPVKLKDYKRFTELSHFLLLDEDAFDDLKITLLSALLRLHERFGETQESMIEKLCELFSIVTRQGVGFYFDETIQFIVGNGSYIGEYNYDLVQKIIVRQNLIFKPKNYKDPIVNEWANKVMKNRQNGTKIMLEDIITTVSAGCGIPYNDLNEYTLYQLYATFYRKCKEIDYAHSTTLAVAGVKDVSIEYFAQNIDLYEEANPYKDLFVSSKVIDSIGNALSKN